MLYQQKWLHLYFLSHLKTNKEFLVIRYKYKVDILPL